MKLIGILLGTFFLICTTTVACDVNTSSEPAYEIIVYGTASCGYTMGTCQDLDNENLDYTFKDVEEDPAAEQEMFDKILESDWYDGQTGAYPIVDVNGEVLMRPTIDEIKSYL